MPAKGLMLSLGTITQRDCRTAAQYLSTVGLSCDNTIDDNLLSDRGRHMPDKVDRITLVRVKPVRND